MPLMPALWRWRQANLQEFKAGLQTEFKFNILQAQYRETIITSGPLTKQIFGQGKLSLLITKKEVCMEGPI